MALSPRSATLALFVSALLTHAAAPAQAGLFTLAASGAITANSSGDATIPVGTPWSFELTYDTTAPDLDFEVTTSPDPTYGRFKNTQTPPALVSFHYKAGSYEVLLDDPTDFSAFSDLLITFTVVHALDVNISSPAFPPLAGGPVAFHADFNAFSAAPIFTSDGLPTNAALSPASFDQSSVTLLPPAGVISGSTLAALSLTAVPEPPTAALQILALLALLAGGLGCCPRLPR
jgi:hypothetical protein